MGTREDWIRAVFVVLALQAWYQWRTDEKPAQAAPRVEVDKYGQPTDCGAR